MMSRASLAFKVPAVVAVFLVAMSLFISQQVLSRLEGIQTAHLQALADVYLDGLSTALVDAVLREDVWEVYTVLDRTRRGGSGLTTTETIVTNVEGKVIASTDPRRITSSSLLPPTYPTTGTHSGELVIREAEASAYARRDVLYNDHPVGAIQSKLNIAPLLAERQRVLWTLILSNMALTVVLVIAAWVTVHRMMRPVQILAAHLEMGAGGEVAPIPDPLIEKAGPEFRRLFSAFNTLAHGVSEREDLIRRLADEEKLASLGRLASGMAHEINNPLGGIFNALDTVKRHGEQPLARANALNLIDRGLRGISDIVRSTLMIYQSDRDGRSIEAQDLDDLRILAAPEVRRNELNLTWTNSLGGLVNLPASHIRQIALNLLLNACQASPKGSEVAVSMSTDHAALRIDVSDSGPGLPEHAVQMLIDPSSTPPPIGRGVGLGLWMTSRLIGDLHGTVWTGRGPLGGALISVTIPIPPEGAMTHVA